MPGPWKAETPPHYVCQFTPKNVFDAPDIVVLRIVKDLSIVIVRISITEADTSYKVFQRPMCCLFTTNITPD